MSSTRHADEDGALRQEKYASSAEFEPGLLASMVARRCQIVSDAKDRELLWFVQHASRQPGGLKAFADFLLLHFGDRVGVAGMAPIGAGKSKVYDADKVRAIRKQFPRELREQFLLRGEVNRDMRDAAFQADHARKLRALQDGILDGVNFDSVAAMFTDDAAILRKAEEEAKALPISYSHEALQAVCREAAEHELENQLRALCLDPACSPSMFAPWFFHLLVPTLRDCKALLEEQRGQGLVETEICTKVQDTLEYTQTARKITLIQGLARRGKSFAARTWCEQHAGRARFVEVPTGNTEKGFFLAIARGLGLGQYTQYKAGEIQDRVEAVLLSGDILLALDEAHRLFPNVNIRYGYPKRIEWICSMANAGVPICLISTHEFLRRLTLLTESGKWETEQLIGRMAHYEELPETISLAELTKIAALMLPSADADTLRAMAAQARKSARYLAAIETVSTRAKFIAARAGRAPSADDVRKAMQESVFAADAKLIEALKLGAKDKEKAPAPALANVLKLPTAAVMAAN